MNKGFTSFAGFLIVGFMACCAAGGLALFFGLTVGGVGAAVAPDFHFGIVGDWVCPEDSTFEFRQVRHSYHEPGEYTIEASCVAEDGEELRGQEFKAIGLVMGGYMLACFVPLFLLGILFSGLLVRVFSKLLKRDIQT